MPRAPFQVLVIPYRQRVNRELEFAVFRRADDSRWQFIAGGGEDGETPTQAAVREASEEAGIPDGVKWKSLNSVAMITRDAFPGGAHWPANLKEVPEYCFAADMTAHDIALSPEHDLFEWLDFEQARGRLAWRSNQDALSELAEKLQLSLK